MRISDLRIQRGEKKQPKGKRNLFRPTAGKGTRSEQWRAYVKANSKEHPSLQG
jgi:hypothetical protein